MTTTANATRTFTAEGETFTTKSKNRFAVVIRGTVYCSDRGGLIGRKDDLAFIAKRSNNAATAVKALAGYASQSGFISGTIVDAEATTV